MKTLDLEIAVMGCFNIRVNTVVPNVSWGLNIHECDILSLTKTGYATEIEIKVSKADLLKDFKKPHNHISNKIKYFYYAVPKKLQEIALETIPERAGLLVCEKRGDELRLNCIRSAIQNKQARQWTNTERQKLQRLGAMRILGLKKKLAKFQQEKANGIEYDYREKTDTSGY